MSIADSSRDKFINKPSLKKAYFFFTLSYIRSLLPSKKDWAEALTKGLTKVGVGTFLISLLGVVNYLTLGGYPLLKLTFATSIFPYGIFAAFWVGSAISMIFLLILFSFISYDLLSSTPKDFKNFHSKVEKFRDQMR